MFSAFFCFLPAPAAAADDGFGASGRLEGKYFEIQYASGLDPARLARKLDIGVAEGFLTDKAPGKTQASALGEMVDVLFLLASEALDIHLYSFRGTIKICATNEELMRVGALVLGRRPDGQVSFYVQEGNTIYISAQHFTREILAHEIAHAITSGYFVVAPPEKVSEILSAYVEFRLRKTVE